MPTPAAPKPSRPVPADRGDRFAVCLAHLFKSEGGFNDIAADRGGATNFGISLRFAAAEARIDPDVRRALDMDMDGDVDGQDIRKLTGEAAAAVYRRCFWDRYRCGEIQPTLDHAVFDQAVNGGGVAAVKMLQQAINLAAGWPALVVDGRIGPRTINLANRRKDFPAGAVLMHYRNVVVERYEAIARASPSQKLFLRGWKNRAAKLGTV